jgi:hypothetical protein
MKPVNLLSHIASVKHAQQEYAQAFSRYESAEPHKIVRDWEEKALQDFCEQFFSASDFSLTEGFFTNFTIPRISKEYDLLRFGKKWIVNIELKAQASEEKILKQLVQNVYYLSPLKKKVFSFSYIASQKRLYQMKERKLYPCTGEQLKEILNEQIVLTDFDIQKAFQPENYLISPFHRPTQFLKGQYFLTTHQDQIEKCILSASSGYFCIQGGPGTGKTLLLYDLIKKRQEKENVCIIHCAKMNDAQNLLRSNGFTILSLKKAFSYLEQNKPDMVVLDEAQCLSFAQFQKLYDFFEAGSTQVVFSLDTYQAELMEENQNNAVKHILQLPDLTLFRLTNRIRTSPQISSFIASLFDLSKKSRKIGFDHIHIAHFEEEEACFWFIRHLISKDYTFIDYPQQMQCQHLFSGLDGQKWFANEVYGLEFDKVCCVMDQRFAYVQNKLCASGKKREEMKYLDLLYQIVTRAKNELYIVVFDNFDLYYALIGLLYEVQRPEISE